MAADGNLRKIFLHAACNNVDAADFLEQMLDTAHFFDDVADADTTLLPSAVEAAAYGAMVALPRNPFYRQFFHELNPIVANAILDWSTANRIEARRATASEHDLRIAFVIRSEYVALVGMVALLCGGLNHARDVAEQLRRIVHAEQYDGYLTNLTAQYGE